MARLLRMPALLLTCGFLLCTMALPGLAQDVGYELKVARPGSEATYTEAFPTEVEATARLWNQVKVDAIEEQTRSLRVEFDQFKAVRFQRQEPLSNQCGSLAIQNNPQPEHYPALMATGMRW